MNDALRIIKPGPYTLLVDSGRRLCQHFGLAAGGAADIHSYEWCNQLLGNPPNTPALEIAAGPFAAEFLFQGHAALCGAEHSAKLNGKPVHNWSSFSVTPGDTLQLGYAQSGVRSYLSVGGVWNVDTLFDSCQRVNDDGSARPIKAGEHIHFSALKQLKLNKMTPWNQIPDDDSALCLPVRPSYQFHRFPEDQRQAMIDGHYTISPQSNRMGYRLQGPVVHWPATGIESEGIALGAVQIPPDGQPIVLLNDRQTIGGYPKIGCVEASACSRLTQRRPGQKVSFCWLDTD